MKKFFKATLSRVTVLLIILTTLFSCTHANNGNYFACWNENSKVVTELTSFVKEATDQNSSKFIPVEERIAVFDMDGTIFCETDPTYYEYLMTFDIVLNNYDKNNSYDVQLVKEINEVLRTGVVSDELELKLSREEYIYFVNKPLSEYVDYVKSYLERDTKSYKNMKIKDMLYKPMLEVIEYLQANEFTVYIVSGTERNFVRTVVCEGAGIHPNHVIGMDFTIKTSKQGNEINSVHQFTRDEYMIIAGPAANINIKTNKVIAINEEIGMVPVLAFGNSTGDFSMMEYTLKNDKYDSKCFMVLCDDNVRENGDIEKAAMIKSVSDQKGYTTISMKDDWKTIYGENVEKVN